MPQRGLKTDERTVIVDKRLLAGLGRAAYQQGTPLAGDVTTLTQLTKLALVFVVLVMAAAAGALDDKFSVHHRLLVAGVATRFFVSAIQLEFGELVMIKIPRCPSARVVTSLAFFTQTLLVRLFLILFVAREAIQRCAAIELVIMAFFAIHHIMRTQ